MEASSTVAKRPKATPKFHVFRETELEGGDIVFEHLTPNGPVEASSRKKAISALLADSEEARCFAIKEGEFDPKRRKFGEVPAKVVRKEIWE